MGDMGLERNDGSPARLERDDDMDLLWPSQEMTIQISSGLGER
jgi:hypothetical protein